MNEPGDTINSPLLEKTIDISGQLSIYGMLSLFIEGGRNLDNIQMLTQLSPLQLLYAIAYGGNPQLPCPHKNRFRARAARTTQSKFFFWYINGAHRFGGPLQPRNFQVIHSSSYADGWSSVYHLTMQVISFIAMKSPTTKFEPLEGGKGGTKTVCGGEKISWVSINLYSA